MERFGGAGRAGRCAAAPATRRCLGAARRHVPLRNGDARAFAPVSGDLDLDTRGKEGKEEKRVGRQRRQRRGRR